MVTRRGILHGLLAGLFARGARGARKQAGGAPPGNVPKGKYRIPPDARAQTRELGRTGVRVSIGFTGHKDPRIHRHMLETARANGFHFDTVQMPINVLDAHYRSFEKEIVPLAQQEGTAVLGMKPLGSGLILESGAASAQDCLRYAMSVSGVSVTITGCDSEAASSARAHPPGDEVGE